MDPVSPLYVLAHPLTQRGELPVSPLFLATAAVVLLAGAARLARAAIPGAPASAPAADAAARPATEAPASAPESTGSDARPATDAPPSAEASAGNNAGAVAPRAPAAAHDFDRDVVPAGAAGVLFWGVRVIGLAVFVFAIVAGRIGVDNQLRNITPALTIGAGWPLLTLASLLLGRVWWWVNPYDTLARPLSPVGAGAGSDRNPDGTWAPVWWAIGPAAVWMAYLTVWPNALNPRPIAMAMIVYTFVTLAGCLAVGRRTWLWRGEVFTVFFGLVAAFRRREPWTPPAGAPALLGVIAGGALFGLFRDSDLGIFIAYGPRANLYSRMAVVAVMAVAALAAERAARRTPPGTVAIALAPAAAVLVVALAISRNRLTTSLQLLPVAASNPLGGGLDLFGTRANSMYAQPLGETGPVWLQVGILVAGSVAGLVMARRSAARAEQHGTTGRFDVNRTARVVLGLLGTLLAIGAASAAAI